MPLSVDTYSNASFIDGLETDYDELRFAAVPIFKVRGQLEDSQIREILVKGVEDLSLEYDLNGIISLDYLNKDGRAIFGKVEPEDDFATTEDLSECYWNDGFKDTPQVEEGTYNLVIPESAQSLKLTSEDGVIQGQISFLLSHVIIATGGNEYANFYGDFVKDESGDILLPHGEWLVICSAFPSKSRFSTDEDYTITPDVSVDKINLFGSYKITEQRSTININKRVEFRFDIDGVMIVMMRLGL